MFFIAQRRSHVTRRAGCRWMPLTHLRVGLDRDLVIVKVESVETDIVAGKQVMSYDNRNASIQFQTFCL
jgi:hypothetical protein